MEESNDSVTTKAKVFIARRSWFRCDIRLMSASLFHRADRTSMLMEFWMAFQVWCEFVIVMYASCCVEILLLHLWSESKLVQIACTVTFSALQKFTFQCKKEIIGFLMFLTWTFGNCRILGFISFWEPFLSIKKWAKIENKGKDIGVLLLLKNYYVILNIEDNSASMRLIWKRVSENREVSKRLKVTEDTFSGLLQCRGETLN